MNTVINDFSKFLKNNLIKPSYPRIKVYEYLATHKTHPTVDEIYNNLVKEIPTLSKTTVYNTLNQFIDAKITRLVSIEDNETRYDADVSDHGHFKCKKCGIIYDFAINMDNVETKDLNRFYINEKNVYYKGICYDCLDNK